MALRPYWQKHPVQLRIFAVLALALFPLFVLWCGIWAAWDERDNVKKFFNHYLERPDLGTAYLI